MKERVQGLLSEIEFSGLEAAVYLALLREPGATGYRLSQMVGKPVANTYKALDSLRVKGAVLVDESSGTRTYAALSIHEYLDGLRRNLETKQAEIERELKDTVVTPMHGGIFQFTSVEQVYERCRNIIKNAKSVVLADAFPYSLEKIRAELTSASKRGVKVFIKAYSPTKFPGCDLVAPEKDSILLKAWNGDWLNIFVDWREFVQSLLKKNNAGIHEAVWSRNPYLAFLAYGGFVNELLLTRVGRMIHTGSDTKEITQELKRLNKQYLEETCLFEVIPDSWQGTWLKEHLKAKQRAGAGHSGQARSHHDSVTKKEGTDWSKKMEV
jgi:sugar-specific transcriptional regulator TrmB